MKQKPITKKELTSLNFKPLEHYTILNSFIYDLGRNRHLSIGAFGTPNETVFICETCNEDSKKITDLICLHNYDYDGYISKRKLRDIIKLLDSKKCNI